jgi:predicted Zn finger-like uncharacterized protein
MKIQCQSCQAKYTIADEKVLGKVVKIRCKKCSATIVINGNETRPAEDNADTHVFDYAGQANDQWTVNVADGDQRTMTGQEIVAEYRTGVVNDETYCWKDGMADWLPLREIEQLYGAVKLAPRGPAHSLVDDDLSVPPQSIPPQASNAAALFSAAEAAPVDSPFAGGGSNGNGYHEPAAAPVAAASAARRGGGRGQGADLFGNVASAGGEEDVMTSAASGSAGHGGGGGAGLEEAKLTGQRNESSVLFSLSALTEGGKSEAASAPNRTTATSDGSGLIDIRALSQNMAGDDKKDTNARVDDIMNLSGGGAFGAALAAPILAPPPIEMGNDPYAQSGGDSGKSNKMLMIAIIAGAAMIAIGIVVAVVLTRPSVPPVDALNPTGTASGLAAAPTGSGPGALAMNDPNAAAAVTAPAGGDNTPPPPGTGNANGKTPAVTGAAKPAAGGGGAAAAKPAAAAGGGAEAVAAAAPKPAEAPKDFAGALAAAAGKPAAEAPKETGGGSTAPFDRGAAQGALGGVNVQSCKKPDGPTGSGHVKITFAPNGSVSSAVVDSGPFPGTPVGGCIAGKFRGAHVPPFGGGPVSVGKSFTIN